MKYDKRVLIVEDDIELQQEFRSIVEENNFEVDTAGNKTEALEKVRCRTYHVGMIDIMLTDDPTDRGGIDVLKYINSLQEGTQAIVLSATPDVRVPVEVWKEGALSYLIKKDIISSEDILNEVEKAYQRCQIRSYGKFTSMIAYLASPEKTPFYEDRLMRLLGGDIDLVRSAFKFVFVPLQPFLRKKNQRFSIFVDGERGMIHGLVWSKALGCAVYVSFGRKECEYVRPEDTSVIEMVFEEDDEEEQFKAAVWRVIAKRDEFIETLYDI